MSVSACVKERGVDQTVELMGERQMAGARGGNEMKRGRQMRSKRDRVRRDERERVL